MSDYVHDKKMTWAKKKIAKNTFSLNEAMREKRPNTEVYLVSIFLYSDLINGDLQSKSPYSVRNRKIRSRKSLYLDTFYAVRIRRDNE